MGCQLKRNEFLVFALTGRIICGDTIATKGAQPKCRKPHCYLIFSKLNEIESTIMFTFHWSELLVVGLCGLVLFFGLALVMLRRRNEVLQKFLTPEEPDLEKDFFRVRSPKQEVAVQEKTLQEETAESESSQTAASPSEETAHWGTENV